MSVRKSLRLPLAVATLAIASPLAAQQKARAAAADTGRTGKGEIAGVVLDSLNGRYLAGAEVIIEGAKATLVTDSVGKFRLDNLPPGTYQVGIFHPLLDTLGLSLATKPFHLGADSATYIVLSVPSAATIIHGACPPRPRSQGTSAVIGHVNDPETLEPVSGADVSIAWTEIEVSKEIGVRRTPRVIRDVTDATGAYHLCGLPNSMQATLQAKRGNSVTAEVPIALGDEATELFTRTLLLSRADSDAKEGNAAVSGKVVLEGTPVAAGTRVELVGTGKIALTNEQGEFSLSKLPSGSHVLLARHLGFGAQAVAVDLTSRAPQRVTVKLPKFVATLEPVVVKAKREGSLEKVGFSQRQKSGMGYYIGPDQLANMHPQYVSDVLRRVPGLQVSSSGQGPDVVSSSRGVSSISGGDCVQYYLDDMPWMSAEPGDINNFVNGSEIAAVEVYQPANVPAEYTRAGSGCTTIVLWTHFKIRDK